MPKITVGNGPSYVDPESGEPREGALTHDATHPNVLQVLPEEKPDGRLSDRNLTDGERLERVHDQDVTAVRNEGDDTEGDREGDAGTEQPGASAAGFDPSGKSVKEVEAYLEDADDAERQRVLNAEAAGKNRPTLLNGKYAAAATQPEGAGAEQQDNAPHDGSTYEIN
jgi:hypothetical protein